MLGFAFIELVYHMKNPRSPRTSNDFPVSDTLKLDTEIQELMIMLQRQNELLSGYYQKLVKTDKRKSGKAFMQVTGATSEQGG